MTALRVLLGALLLLIVIGVVQALLTEDGGLAAIVLAVVLGAVFLWQFVLPHRRSS